MHFVTQCNKYDFSFITFPLPLIFSINVNYIYILPVSWTVINTVYSNKIRYLCKSKRFFYINRGYKTTHYYQIVEIFLEM